VVHFFWGFTTTNPSRAVSGQVPCHTSAQRLPYLGRQVSNAGCSQKLPRDHLAKQRNPSFLLPSQASFRAMARTAMPLALQAIPLNPAGGLSQQNAALQGGLCALSTCEEPNSIQKRLTALFFLVSFTDLRL